MSATLALPQQLTLRDAKPTLKALVSAMAASGTPAVTMDAAALAQIDTSALAVLLECQREARRQQRTLVVVNAPARLVELAHLYGVQDLLGLPVAQAESAAPPVTP